jgi:DNA helicase-2/ATP-dependent DNA helicase PcrA
LQESFDPSLAPEDRSLVEEELRLLEAVREALADAGGQRRWGGDLRARLLSLREELATAGESDRPALLAELDRVRATARHARPSELPDPRAPYFAHMHLETEAGSRDVLLGYRTFIDAKRRVVLVDWREAPVARIFFQYEEGEDYEEAGAGRLANGVLLRRRVLAFEGGELAQINAPDRVLRRAADGRWTREGAAPIPRLSGGEGGDVVGRLIGTGLSGRKLPVVSSLLDREQYQALTRDPRRPLLVLGGAGCGKTTVALHRLAYLAHREPDFFRPQSMLVLVPEEGLVRLTRTLLDELGLEPVGVQTVDEWFAAQARRLLRGIPRRLAVQTRASVIRFKRHPATASLLPAVAEEAGRACARRLDHQLGTGAVWEAAYDRRPDLAPLQRLERAHAELRKELTGEAAKLWKGVFERERRRFLDAGEDRERLFGDRALLAHAVEASGGELPPRAVEEVVEHTRLQLSPTSEEEYAHVAPDRLQTVDGLAIDSGTPREDAGSVDVEDFALLLELQRFKTGAAEPGRLTSYAHLVIDEAQELAPVELRVLGRALAQRGSITVAGDSAQQIDVTVRFGGWPAVVDALGVEGSDPVVLETSYRCTKPILDFAHRLLGPLAPESPPRSTKDGAPVVQSRFATEMHAAVFLGEALLDLQGREPRAQVGILARSEERARRLHDTLPERLRARLVLDGRFSFRAGVDVSCVQLAKGLEWDYVVIPDASSSVYPLDPVSRRTLHVAATRAIHQLWVVAVGDVSPLLAGAAA